MVYPNIMFDGTIIKRSVKHVHLGLIITSSLSWQRNIDKAITKTNRIIYVMSSIKMKLPRNSLCALYKSMLLPVTEYFDIIIDNCTVRAALALENIQRQAARACTGAYRHTSNDRLLAELNWIPLRQRSTRQTDRQTDGYFIDRNKSHYRLICHSNKRDICTYIYKNVN